MKRQIIPALVASACFLTVCSDLTKVTSLGVVQPASEDNATGAVARYAGPKGNLQFPLDEPMPLALIERVVRLRVRQDTAKAAAKRGKRSKAAGKPEASK